MIDHIILTVSDLERSVAFYVKALKPLGITNFTDYEGHDGHPDLQGFGGGQSAFFWLKARKHLKLGSNTILAPTRHGCSILTATTSRSFIKAKLIFIVIGASRV